MVNRSIISFSNSSRALRQGDPFSMLLLILVMEVHDRILHNTVEGAWQHFMLGTSPLLFVFFFFW